MPIVAEKVFCYLPNYNTKAFVRCNSLSTLQGYTCTPIKRTEVCTEDMFDIIRAVARNQTQPGCLYSQLRQGVIQLLTEKRLLQHQWKKHSLLPTYQTTFDLQWYKSCMAMTFLPFLFVLDHIKFVKYLYHVPSLVPKHPPFYLPLTCIIVNTNGS